MSPVALLDLVEREAAHRIGRLMVLQVREARAAVTELVEAAKAVKPYFDGSHSEAAKCLNAGYMTRAQWLRNEADAIEAKDAAIARFAAALAKFEVRS